MPLSVKEIQKNSDRAYGSRKSWAALYDDLYQYVLPYREPSTATNTGGTAADRVDRVFDSTAPKAAFRFAGRMQNDVTPPFQRFFELKLGPYLQADPDVKKSAEEELEQVTKQVSAVLEAGTWALSSHEMYLDLFGGQGACLMLEDEDEILRFVSVPAVEVALREDGFGRVIGVYWDRNYEAGQLPGLWPEAETKFSAELQKTIKDTPEKAVRVVQAAEWDHKKRKWHFCAFEHGKEDGPIYSLENMNTSPWLTPRFFKVPGEAHGRGPGLMALPAIKTLNKVTELTLKAAAFAILGLWTHRNDRVFNPKTARMAPGAFWPVASNGGPLGPSISKLDVPGRFDISNIVVTDLRDAVKQATFDDTLPPDAGAVRSATEIVERLKRLATDLAGAYARLVLEIIKPLVQRIIDVLYRRKLIKTNLTIDQLLLKVEIVSPIARAQQAQDVSQLVDWLQIILATGGKEAMMLTAKIEDVFTEIGRKLGVPERLIRSERDKGQLMKMVAQIIANAQMAAAPKQSAAAPAGVPA